MFPLGLHMIFKLEKVKVGDDQYSNQCKKVTIQNIEINSADDESLTLMSDQIIPSDMQDSGNAKIVFSLSNDKQESTVHQVKGHIGTNFFNFSNSGPVQSLKIFPGSGPTCSSWIPGRNSLPLNSNSTLIFS